MQSVSDDDFAEFEDDSEFDFEVDEEEDDSNDSFASIPDTLRQITVSWCPHFNHEVLIISINKPHYSDVIIQRVGIVGFHCIQRCPHFRGLE